MSRVPARRLSQVEVELASRGQMLPFEPIDLGPVLGDRRRACRPSAPCSPPTSRARAACRPGAARDYLLGRPRRQRARRDLQVGRPGHEERDRLRRGAWARGKLGHARRVVRGDVQGPAAAGRRRDAGLSRSHGRSRRRADEPPWRSRSRSPAPCICRPALATRLKHKTLSKGEAVADRHPSGELHALDHLSQADGCEEALCAYGEPLELDLESSLAFWTEMRRFRSSA